MTPLSTPVSCRPLNQSVNCLPSVLNKVPLLRLWGNLSPIWRRSWKISASRSLEMVGHNPDKILHNYPWLIFFGLSVSGAFYFQGWYLCIWHTVHLTLCVYLSCDRNTGCFALWANNQGGVPKMWVDKHSHTHTHSLTLYFQQYELFKITSKLS